MHEQARDTKEQYLKEGGDKRRGKMHNSERKILKNAHATSKYKRMRVKGRRLQPLIPTEKHPD